MKVKNFMKKFSALVLGLGLTLGVVSAVDSNSAHEVDAETKTLTFATTSNEFTKSTNSAHTYDSKYIITCSELSAVNANYIQMKKGTDLVHSNTPIPGTITGLKFTDCFTSSTSSFSVTAYGSTNGSNWTQISTISSITKTSYNASNPDFDFNFVNKDYNFTYFKISVGSTRTFCFSSIVVTYEEKAAHTHSSQLVSGTPATCTVDGTKSYYECTSTTNPCGKYFKNAECTQEIGDAAALDTWLADASADGGKIPATGHNWVVVDTTATCEAAGNTNYECSVCHATKSESGQALGHHMVAGTVHASTCTEGGYTEYHCDRAGCTHTDVGNETEALGHNWITDPNNANQEICSRNCGATRAVQSYQKITSTDDLVDGGKYLIVYEEGNVALNGQLIADSTKNGVSVVINSGKIKKTTEMENVAFTYCAADGSLLGGGGKYIGHTGAKNTLDYSDSAFSNSISFDKDGNVIIASGDYSLRYNTTSDQLRFRFYTGTSQKNIQLFGLPPEAAIKSITVDSTGTCAVGGNAELTHSITAVGGASTGVKWISLNPDVATVDENGKVTGVSAGQTTIRVTSSFDESKYADCTFTVTAATIHVTGISLSESTKTVVYGEEFTLTPTILPADATNKSVTWNSSDENVVIVDDGVCLAGDIDGTATITVKTVDGELEASCVVTVQDPDSFDSKYESTIIYRNVGDSSIMGDGWTTSYLEHEYTDTASGVVTTFSAASKPNATSAISNMPAVKNSTVTLEAPTGKCFESMEIHCKKWGTYGKTISVTVGDATLTSTEFYLDIAEIPGNLSTIVFNFNDNDNRQIGINGVSFKLVDKTTETLDQPTNLLFDNSTNTLSWDAVEHASGYMVKLGNGQYEEVAETSKVFSELDSETTYKAYVIAKGDEVSYSNSEAAEIEFTTPAIPLEEGIYTATINSDSFTKTGSGNGYADFDGVRSVNVKASDTNNEGVIKVRSSNVMISSGKLQFKKEVQSYIEITTGLGAIVSVKAGEEELTSETSPAVITGETLKILADNSSSTIQLENIVIKFEIGEYQTYRWVNGNQVLDEVRQLASWEAPAYAGEEPVKEADNDYTYEFNGWVSSTVEGVVVYSADFEATAIEKSEMAEQFEGLEENMLPMEGASVVFEEAAVVQGKAMVTAKEQVLMTIKAEEGKALTGFEIDLRCDYTVSYKKLGSEELVKLCDVNGDKIVRSARPGKLNGNNIDLPDEVGEVVISTAETAAVELKALSVNSDFYMEKGALVYMTYNWTEINGDVQISNLKLGLTFTFDYEEGRLAGYTNEDYIIEFRYLAADLTLEELAVQGKSVVAASFNEADHTSFGFMFSNYMNKLDALYSVALIVKDAKTGEIVDGSGVIQTTLREVFEEYLLEELAGDVAYESFARDAARANVYPM